MVWCALTFVPGLMKTGWKIENGKYVPAASWCHRTTFSFKSVRQGKGQGRPSTVTKAYRARGGTAPLIRDLRTLKCSSKLQLQISLTPGHKSDKHVNMTNFFNMRWRLTTQDPIQIFSLKTISSKLGLQYEKFYKLATSQFVQQHPISRRGQTSLILARQSSPSISKTGLAGLKLGSSMNVCISVFAIRVRTTWKWWGTPQQEIARTTSKKHTFCNTRVSGYIAKHNTEKLEEG